MLCNIFDEIIKTAYSLQSKYKNAGMEYIPILYQHFPHQDKACKEKRTAIYEDKNQRLSKTKTYNTTAKKAVIRRANITDGKYCMQSRYIRPPKFSHCSTAIHVLENLKTNLMHANRES